MSKNNFHTHETLMNPTLQALKDLGGSATIEELLHKVAEKADISDEQMEVLHNPEKGGRTEIEYRLAWTRTYLKTYGIIENSSRGIWSLTAKGRQIDKVNPKTVSRYLRALKKEQKTFDEPEVGSADDLTWQEELLDTLLQMDPAAFERLVQRMLRESGFIQVEVTGRSGDGGIDGKGILRLSGLLSFHVIFQCKRYKGAVTASQIRDFRGAMVGRADKGLVITTGSFTKDALSEATRDGAPAIDLIDGGLLVEKLKELGLGVITERVQVEEMSIDKNWFLSL